MIGCSSLLEEAECPGGEVPNAGERVVRFWVGHPPPPLLLIIIVVVVGGVDECGTLVRGASFNGFACFFGLTTTSD